MNRIEEWVNKWSIEDDDQSYREINTQTNFYAKELFHDYEPIQGQASNFRSRLERWLLNAENDNDRKTLFRLLRHLFYIGNKEIVSMYRVAYDELIATWLINTMNVSLRNFQVAKERIENGIRDCWICPITDSMLINQFFHVNQIPNNNMNEWRPLWYGIGKPTQAAHHQWNSHLSYINEHGINKIVLLEDMVGSGSQIRRCLEFILRQRLDIDILVLPLITCPVGVTNLEALADNYDRLTFKSVIKPSANGFVTENPSSDEPSEYEAVRELVKRNYLQVSDGHRPGNRKPYSPFGFRSTGGLIVKSSNTPDNTLPIIHWNSNTWNPLFPRHSRN